MRNIARVLCFLGIALLVAPAASADQCLCAAGWDAGISRPFPIDWRAIESYEAKSPFEQPPAPPEQQRRCEQSCKLKAQNDPRFNSRQFWCTTLNRPFNGAVNAYASIFRAGYDWKVVQTIPVKCCSIQGPATCASGWTMNPAGTDPKRCVKQVCSLPPPAIPDTTPIGPWGFVWHNAVYQWGPPVAAGTTQIQPCP